MHKNLSLAAALAIAFLFAFPALAKDKTPDVRDALKAWAAAVESGSVDDITDLYDSHAVMISTFQEKPITSHAGLVKYYHMIEANSGIKVDINEQHPRVFGNVAVNSGLYTFHDIEDGEPVTTPARFSFTYILKDGKWIIVDHHSSRMPGASNSPSPMGSERHQF